MCELYVCVHPCMCMCVDSSLCVCVSACVLLCACVCVFNSRSSHLWPCPLLSKTHICIHSHACVCVYVCMPVCVCVCVAADMCHPALGWALMSVLIMLKSAACRASPRTSERLAQERIRTPLGARGGRTGSREIVRCLGT